MKYRSYVRNFSLVSVSFGTDDLPKRLLRDCESRNHHRIENRTLSKAEKFPYLLLDLAKRSAHCAYCKPTNFVKKLA
jgi:hypothetical protein